VGQLARKAFLREAADYLELRLNERDLDEEIEDSMVRNLTENATPSELTSLELDRLTEFVLQAWTASSRNASGKSSSQLAEWRGTR
jgi:hypothetical protein